MNTVRQKLAALMVVAVVAGLPVMASLPVAAQELPAFPDEVGSANLVPIQVTGEAEDRLNLILLGDGYTAEELDDFRADVDRNLATLWTVEPFRSYRNYLNIYALEIVSGQTGIRCDPENTPRGGDMAKDTPLRLWFSLLGEPGGCADPNARGIQYGPAPAGSPPGTPNGNQQRTMYLETYVAPELGIPADSQNLQTLALANTQTYGGIGGVHATTSGGSPQGPLISVHELGHSTGNNYPDEYPYLLRGVPGGPHPGGEPSAFNHTTQSEQEMLESKTKWWRWLGEESESGGTIGVYESGLQKSSGVYRPSRHSMMRWLGYYFDQIGREHMVGRISGMRFADAMPLPSLAQGEVGPTDVVWVEPMHPQYHELDVTWRINGEVVPDTHNSANLELAQLGVTAGDTIQVTVSDPTEFVRDPELANGPRMTQTREWTVGRPLARVAVPVAFTRSTYPDAPVDGDEIVYVETTHPADRVLDVTWRLDGVVVENPHKRRTFDLGALDLAPGTYGLTATVTDPAAPGVSQTLSWRVDNNAPVVEVELSEPLEVVEEEPLHNTYCETFTMNLHPSDDEAGHVAAEFRLNGDGWHNFYGWPDAPPGTPFKFTPRGTNIKEIIYGALSPGGMVWAPFEQREAGYGTHTVEYRAIDAAGNISQPQSFTATVLPWTAPECVGTLPALP